MMKHKLSLLWLPVAAALLGLAVLFTVLVRTVRAQQNRTTALGESAELAPLAPPVEVWRLGVVTEEKSGYADLAGRLASPAANFLMGHSLDGVPVDDIYFIFPASANPKTIEAAQFHVITNTLSGSYSGTANLTLEVRDFSGALQHTVSSSAVDLAAAPVNVWTPVALSATPADLAIGSGEFLAFHLIISSPGDPASSITTEFEVVVK